MTFKVTKLSGSVPSGWRMATCDEFLANRDECLRLMDDWSIAACKDGKCDGRGYGGNATKGSSHDGIGDMLITSSSGSAQATQASSQPKRKAQSERLTQFTRLNYMDDIPDDYRLLTCNEFEEYRDQALRNMDEWAICLLTDGKCDGRGYGAKATRLSRHEREGANRTHMGEMLLTYDSGGQDLKAFAAEVYELYNSAMSRSDDTATVNKYLVWGPRYQPSVVISSCPGDAHGGVHTRMKDLAESQSWRFAPVQFTDPKQAASWKRLWKIQVEEFACDLIAEAGRKRSNVEVLEIKIDGGGAGCETERSRNMTHWWIDWVKRLGSDICEDLAANTASDSPFCPPGCVQIQIGQVLLTEADLTEFPRASGNRLHPVPSKGIEFELHTLVLSGSKRYWKMITDMYSSRGGGASWARNAGKTYTSCGTF